MIRSLLEWKLSAARQRFDSGRLAASATVLVALTVAAAAPAQTWNIPADGDWSDGSNWVGSAAPMSSATAALVFGSPAIQTASYIATNDIANPFQLNSLTFNNTAGIITLTGSGL